MRGSAGLPSKSRLPESGQPEKVRVAETVGGTYNINGIKITSLVDAHLEYTGRVSGKLYRWDRAGAVTVVDERDAPELLEKRIGNKSCCGGSRHGTLVFQKAE